MAKTFVMQKCGPKGTAFAAVAKVATDRLFIAAFAAQVRRRRSVGAGQSTQVSLKRAKNSSKSIVSTVALLSMSYGPVQPNP